MHIDYKPADVSLTGTLVPMATTTSPIVNSPIWRIQPTRATIVTMAKLMTAIQTIDMTKEPATRYHFRFSEQFGMVHVKATMKGKEMMKRIHFRTNFTHPSLPSSLASWISGGAVRIAGRHGMRTMRASSSSSSV